MEQGEFPDFRAQHETAVVGKTLVVAFCGCEDLQDKIFLLHTARQGDALFGAESDEGDVSGFGKGADFGVYRRSNG